MRIKKTYNGVVPNGKVLNSDSTSVTDTYSCNYINNLHNYVPDETQIGWYEFDGVKKPLYRKEITGTLGTTGADDLGTLIYSDLITDVKGRIISISGYKIPINFNNGESFITYALTAEYHLMLYYSNNFSSGTYRLIFEYVK